jgi:hypothetical protein
MQVNGLVAARTGTLQTVSDAGADSQLAKMELTAGTEHGNDFRMLVLGSKI